MLRLERRPHARRRVDHHADAAARVGDVARHQRRERIGQRQREERQTAPETAAAAGGVPTRSASERSDPSSAGTTRRCRPGRRDRTDRTISSSTISANTLMMASWPSPRCQYWRSARRIVAPLVERSVDELPDGADGHQARDSTAGPRLVANRWNCVFSQECSALTRPAAAHGGRQRRIERRLIDLGGPSVLRLRKRVHRFAERIDEVLQPRIGGRASGEIAGRDRNSTASALFREGTASR